MAPEVSVVVPTFNRIDTLPEVLDALARQEGAPSFEVIVVDDGSTDDTARWLAARPADDLPLRTLRQENRGPAAARNAGVAVARGEWVAFLGDGIVPEKGHPLAPRHRDSRVARRRRTTVLLTQRSQR